MKQPNKIHSLSINEISPSRANALIYQPVRSDDPTIVELAQSVSEYGILEPLIITRDGVIVSGHRRYTAARLAGLEKVPCRILPMEIDDPRFTELLTTCNQQRIKTLDEFMREIIARANPDEEYQALIKHRASRSEVNHNLERIELRDYKGRKEITSAKGPLLDAIRQVLKENREYWPLSDRQVHYRLLPFSVLRHASKPGWFYCNNKQSYKDLTDLLTRARLAEIIPFEAIGDETRPMVIWDCHETPQSFAKREIDNFLKGYWRDLLQSQPNHIELIGEKLTLEGTIRPVLMRHTIPYTIGRGYASLDPRHKLVKPFRASGKERLILLVLSDFDPDGDEIAHSFVRSLRDDFDLDEELIEPIRVALTMTQIREFQLVPVMAAKETSSNYDRFIERYANTVVHELDALTPAQLQTVLTQAIDSVIGVEVFNAELNRGKEDSAWLSAVRRTVHEALRSLSLEEC
jgi:hypothetical protein